MIDGKIVKLQNSLLQFSYCLSFLSLIFLFSLKNLVYACKLKKVRACVKELTFFYSEIALLFNYTSLKFLGKAFVI